MRVNILETLDGARRATGLVVVVDVFRACSTAYWASAAGADLVVVPDQDRAAELKRSHPDWLFMGDGPASSLDIGYSPTLLEQKDISGQTVALVGGSGPQGLYAASEGDTLLLGAFVNAQAMIRYILNSEASEVTLVAMGSRGQVRSPEDTMCAMYIKNGVEDYPNSFEVLCNHFRSIPAAQCFFDAARTDAPEQDFDRCLDLDRFPFVLEARQDNAGIIRLIPIVPEWVETTHGGAA